MIQCFTCDLTFDDAHTKFILYQCLICKEKTPYCFHCIKIISRVLSPQLFKCFICNSITQIMTKEEVILDNEINYSNSNNRERYTTTPQSGLFSIETPNKSLPLGKSFLFKTPRNSTSFREEDCINEFNQLKLDLNRIQLHNSNKEDEFANRFLLLRNRSKSRTRTNKGTITPRKSDLLHLSVNDSEIKSQFDGYNKKSKKHFIPLSLRKEPHTDVIPSKIVEQSKLASMSISKIQFNQGYDESDKPVYGVKCKLSDSCSHLSLSSSQIPNLTSSSFKLS